VTGGRTWALVAIAAAVVSAAAFLAAGGARRSGVEERAQSIASGLRCPVCQNLSVADSPSRLAGEMRSEIQDQVRAGRSDEDVRGFFVARYGEWVLLEPTRSGLNLLPWLFPIAAVIVGASIWLTILRRRPGWSPEEAVSEAERRRIEAELAGLEDAR
jgi:cytochrome c-type biogenesis protein CcmH